MTEERTSGLMVVDLGSFEPDPMRVVFGEAIDELSRLQDGAVQAVISDPPYDLAYDVMQRYLTEFRRVCHGTIVLFAAPENQWPQADQYLFWTKPISTKNTSKKYSRFVEMIQVYHGEHSKWNNDRNWANYTNVFTDYVEAKVIHPYQKPLSLMTRLVLTHSDEGDCILDPFCGSGTTLVAAQASGRRAVGVESDKTHYDNTLTRLGKSSWISPPKKNV